jgi:UDP-N-acetylglucosamine 2-epimerase (non-hydrolysing)
MRIVCVVGARPNLMKMAPLMWEMRRYPDLDPYLVHTGQHYDECMSDVFFRELDLPRPDAELGVGSGSHARQTAEVMLALEPVLEDLRPELVIVVGDVNSTLAAALVASKMGVPVGHVEAGLRSFDAAMPEEVNRRLTDALSDYLFIPSPDAGDNLRNEGTPSERIHFVGNVMVDTLMRLRARAGSSRVRQRLGIDQHGYGLVTVHRPSNVDDPGVLRGIVNALRRVAREIPLVFPVHPRTRRRLSAFGLSGALPGGDIHIVDPFGYLDMLDLMEHADLVLTDSGGVQEETSVLGVPCVTVRETTERPVTVTEGTNRVVGIAPGRIVAGARAALAEARASRIPERWDGAAAARVLDVISRSFAVRATRTIEA